MYGQIKKKTRFKTNIVIFSESIKRTDYQTLLKSLQDKYQVPALTTGVKEELITKLNMELTSSFQNLVNKYSTTLSNEEEDQYKTIDLNFVPLQKQSKSSEMLTSDLNEDELLLGCGIMLAISSKQLKMKKVRYYFSLLRCFNFYKRLILLILLNKTVELLAPSITVLLLVCFLVKNKWKRRIKRRL